MSSNLVVRGGRAARSVATALTCFVAMLLMASVPAHAQILWSASSGDWSVGPNWSGGLVPTSTSNVWIANGGTANITQLGETCGTLSLGSSAGSGSTQMSGGSLSVISYEYVGNSGAGTFTVSTGTDSTSVLTIGNNAGSVGAFNLTGNSRLSAGNATVGSSGTASFTQSGGTSSITNLILGYHVGSNGTYSLDENGSLYASNEYVAFSGAGTLTQSGGTNSLPNYSNSLYLGFNAGSNGTYSLSKSGLLSVGAEYVGYVPGAVALFQQTGGSNTTYVASIGSGGCYLLGGGTLQVAGLVNHGSFVGNGAPALLNANSSILYMSSGTWQDLGAIVLSASNSLLIVAAGSDPAAGFAAGSTLGLTHTLGTTLTLSAGQSFGGSGSINDPVVCQGTINATSNGCINMNNGLVLSGTGNVYLGPLYGSLTVSDTISAATGGTLQTNSFTVSSTASRALFTQSGGSVRPTNLGVGTGKYGQGAYMLSSTGQLTVGSVLSIGVGGGNGVFTQSSGAVSAYQFAVGADSSGTYGSVGTYNMNGGSANAANITIGWNGAGQFVQTGGTISNEELWLDGTYNMSGGLLSGFVTYVGLHAKGTFTQSGGTCETGLTFGSSDFAGSSGTYNLNGGVLMGLSGASGTGAFNITGGTVVAIPDYTPELTTIPISLGAGGRATFDTLGYPLIIASTISGAGSLTKLDTGTLTLAASNSYAGATDIDGGTLSLANFAALAGGGNITFGGGTLQFSSSNSQDYSARIVSSTGPISIDTNGANIAFNSTLASSNSGGLTKVGSGTLLLHAADLFSGNTLISGGTLALGSPLALQQSTLDTSGSGTLNFSSLTTSTIGGLTGPGSLNLANSASSRRGSHRGQQQHQHDVLRHAQWPRQLDENRQRCVAAFRHQQLHGWYDDQRRRA